MDLLAKSVHGSTQFRVTIEFVSFSFLYTRVDNMPLHIVLSCRICVILDATYTTCTKSSTYKFTPFSRERGAYVLIVQYSVLSVSNCFLIINLINNSLSN